MAAPQRWTEEDDLTLRLVLEEADGKASWGQVTKRAFPDGKHTKKDCQDVRSSSLSVSAGFALAKDSACGVGRAYAPRGSLGMRCGEPGEC